MILPFNCEEDLYVNTAYPSISFIKLSYNIYSVRQYAKTRCNNIRHHFTDPASLLTQLFVPEWTARAVDALETIVDTVPGYEIDLLNCLGPEHQDSQRPDMVDAFLDYNDNMRIFCIPTNFPGNEPQICVANTDGTPLSEISPFDQLFKMSGLPFPTEVVAAPRDYYELEKIYTNGYRLTKKEYSPSSPPAVSDPIVSNRLDLPPELWYNILRLAIAPQDKVALIPRILWMRLVNHTWNEIAIHLYNTCVIIPASRIPSLVDYPTAFRPYLRRLRFHDESLDQHIPPVPDTFENSVIIALAESPNLDEIVFVHPEYREIPSAHVIGWCREGSVSDVLETMLVAQLDSHLRQLDQFDTENVTIFSCISEPTDRAPLRRLRAIVLADIFHSAPTRFHCLTPPGEALILALGRFLTGFIRCYNNLQAKEDLEVLGQDFPILETEFDVAREWGVEKAVRWFEEEKPWVRGEWPEEVQVSVCGCNETMPAIMSVSVEESGRQLSWQYEKNVLLVTW